MNRNLYSRGLSSIKAEVKNIIREQFNINDLDFNDTESDYSVNVFNKATVDPFKVYKKLKIGKNIIEEWEIKQLNSLVSVVKVEKQNDDDSMPLYNIVSYYKRYYQTDSLNWLDVSDIEYMGYLFIRRKIADYDFNYNGDISKWDVSNVTHMPSIFKNSTFNGDISQWDVSNVNNMQSMFENSTFNQDISDWNVSNVKIMADMFYNSIFNKDISRWNVSSVTRMNGMFAHSQFTGDISKWNVSNVKNMSEMFMDSQFNGNISEWDMSNVENITNIFKDSKFNQNNIFNWDLSSAINYNNAFENCPLGNKYMIVKSPHIKKI